MLRKGTGEQYISQTFKENCIFRPEHDNPDSEGQKFHVFFLKITQVWSKLELTAGSISPMRLHSVTAQGVMGRQKHVNVITSVW